MAVNNILVTETTPKVSRWFQIQRGERNQPLCVGQDNGSITMRTARGDVALSVTVNEAKALIEVLQELTR